jgi:hypothetical protein
MQTDADLRIAVYSPVFLGFIQAITESTVIQRITGTDTGNSLSTQSRKEVHKAQ